MLNTRVTDDNLKQHFIQDKTSASCYFGLVVSETIPDCTCLFLCLYVDEIYVKKLDLFS